MSAISILMPVYNGEAYLRETIESCLAQTFTDFELVIVDDGSTDRSKAIIESYDDPRIRLIENSANLGQVASMNKGAALCKGRYIARLDADDVCEPRRLEKQYRFLERHPHIGMCGTWAHMIDPAGAMLKPIVVLTDPAMVAIALLFYNPIIHPSVMIRTELLRQHPYPDRSPSEDYELWTRLADITSIANLPCRLLRYRWHPANLSSTRTQLQMQYARQTLDRLLQQIGLQPTAEQLRIHHLSGEGGEPISSADLEQVRQWYAELRAANERTRRYDPAALRAFLWGRWIGLCVVAHRPDKALFTRLASLDPRVLGRLLQHIVQRIQKYFYIFVS